MSAPAMSSLTSSMLLVRDLGVLDYDAAWAMQKQCAADRISGALAHDTLLLVQHPPVVTLGRSTKPGNLLATAAFLEANGIQLREVERGGDITVHEPGQLVAYPIVDLKQHKKDLHWYLRQLEESIIQALAAVGVPAERRAGLTGVWRDDRKLASIGVHARDWVTWHGVALNVCNDLRTFDHVVPCGIDQVVMTTVARECAALQLPAPTFEAMSRQVAQSVATTFELELREG